MEERYQDYSRRITEEAREAQRDEEASVGCMGYALIAVAVVAVFAWLAANVPGWMA